MRVAFLGLDIPAGARIVKSEQFGDWYRDPWGWPESTPDFASTLTPRDLGVVKDGTKYVYDVTPDFHRFDVPKSFLGIRPAVVQDVRTRLAYTTASLHLARTLHADLPEWVFGWRMRDGDYGRSREWELYRDSQSEIRNQSWAAQTDINSFFASINATRLLERIVERIGGENTSTSILRAVFEAHNLLHGRSGIPQRSAASAMLAHTALRQVDDLLASLKQDGKITAARRWMDDISFEGPEHALYGALLQLQQSCRQEGLEVNALKTLLISGDESAERLQDEAQGLIKLPTTTSTVTNDYEEFEMTYVDVSALKAAEAEVLAAPQRSPRSKVGIVLKSLIRYEEFTRVAEWMAASQYLPHAADKVGRFLAAANRDSFWGLDLAGWFIQLHASAWPHLEWVEAQYALAVPSDDVDDDMRTVLREWLGASTNLQKVAVAVQRLAASDSVAYRSVVNARLDAVHDPLLVRLLALGLLVAGQSRTDVKAALQRYPSNALTLKYLEERNWKLPEVSEDFDPSHDDGTDSEEDDDDDVMVAELVEDDPPGRGVTPF